MQRLFVMGTAAIAVRCINPHRQYWGGAVCLSSPASLIFPPLLYGAPSMSLDRLQRSQDMLVRVLTQLEQQQNQCQASVAVVTLAANPRAHQSQSRHSSDVIAAVPEFTAE